MFRRKSKHSDQVRDELAEGIGHLRAATAHAAAGAKQRMAPAVDNALVTVGLRKKSRRRWPWIAGTAVVVTAAAGAAGVLIWRRNNANIIDEELFADEPEPPVENIGYQTPAMETHTRTMAGASVD